MSTLLGPIGAAEAYTRAAYHRILAWIDKPTSENASKITAALDLAEAEIKRAREALTESVRKVA